MKEGTHQSYSMDKEDNKMVLIINSEDYPFNIEELRRLIGDFEHLYSSCVKNLKNYSQDQWIVTIDTKAREAQLLIFEEKIEVERFISAELDEHTWVKNIYHAYKFYTHDVKVSIYPETMKEGKK